jgi:hypothetical protein
VGLPVPILYHGTSTLLAVKIFDDGLHSPCLTDDEDKALYYAEEACEAEGGEPVVLIINDIEEGRLLADATAISEPVMIGIDEEDLWDRADAATLALGVEGWADLPWRVSLGLCGSVRFRGCLANVHLSIAQ